MATMLDYALRYAKMGLAVFPIKSQDKRPLTANGCKDATTNEIVVRDWWERYPNANIGIATGSKSKGLFVIDLDIDIDKDKDGREELKDWELKNGRLAETWTSTTGRGGSHLFFTSDKTINNRTGLLEGVDIRGEGGYIVAPPSLHANGRRYEWDLAPLDIELATADETVYKLLEYQEEGQFKSFVAPQTIGEGKRNETLFKMASSLQEKGFDDESILALLEVENLKKCVPPLDKKDLELIVKSISRYEKGKSKFIENTCTPWECKAYLTFNEKGKIVQSIENVRIVMNRDENLAGRFYYNSFGFSAWIRGKLPWCSEEEDREWTNLDDSYLKCYLEEKYGLFNSDKVMDALSIVTNENKFNPVCEYLESLEWDGITRIDNLLPKYLGVTKSEYTTEVTKIFLLGAISRAFHSGCKFDYMPVFVGGQGVGKSTFLKLLAIKEEWNEDNFNTVETDKAVEKLRSKWIVEFAELLALKRAKEVESMKAFLTSTHDTYRPPYARRTESRARQCVFFGTTNDSRFLVDKTGNRRFLPLPVSKDKVQVSIFEDLKATKEEIIKVWAEAMHIFKNEKFTLVLSPKIQEQAELMQEVFLEEDPRVGYIQEFLNKTSEVYVCVPMIHEKALGNELAKPTRRESNEIHEILEHSIKGWKRVENKSNGKVRHKIYGLQISYERVPVVEEHVQEAMKLPFE